MVPYRCSVHPTAPETPAYAQRAIIAHVVKGSGESFTCLETDIRCYECSRGFIARRPTAKLLQGVHGRL